MRQADRLGVLTPVATFEARRRAQQLRAQGVDVIGLEMGDPEQPTAPHIVDALKEAAADPVNQRYPRGGVRGLPAYRQATAEWYQRRFGVAVDPDRQVMTLIGSKEGSHHAAMALLNPGDVALAPDPGYPAYASSAALTGASVVGVPLVEANDFLVDFAAIPAAVAERARLMWLSYPNNPTTSVAGLDFFARAVDFAHRNDLVLIHDNPYCEITFDGYRAPSILEVDGADSVAVEFTSLSKTHNMAGYRLGAAVGNAAVISAVIKVKETVDSGAFTAVQYAGIAALTGPQDAVARNVDHYRRQRDYTLWTLRELGLEVRPPQGTIYVWAPTPAGLSSAAFTGRVLEHAGVAVTPGSGYGRQGEGFFRISLAVEQSRLHNALHRMASEWSRIVADDPASAAAALPHRPASKEGTTMSDDIKVNTEENELSLREMSEALPDTSTIMARVGQAWWHLIYAARGGNWDLADYYLRRTKKLENTLKKLRPKHRERLDRFQAVALPAVVAAIEKRDLTGLEEAYRAATDMANELHSESGYPYVHWQTPTEPPKGLRLHAVPSSNGQEAPSATDR